MRAHGWFEEELEGARDTFEYKLEGLELDLTEKILLTMEEKNVNRAELAKRLGVSKASISKLLNNGSNLPIKRLLAIAEALQCEIRVDFAPTLHQSEENVVDYTPKPRAKELNRNIAGKEIHG